MENAWCGGTCYRTLWPCMFRIEALPSSSVTSLTFSSIFWSFSVFSGHELESEAKLEKGGKSLGRLVQSDHSKESWEWHSVRANFYCSSCINYKYLYSNSHRIMQSSHQQSLTHEGVPTKIVLTAVLYRSFLMSLLVSIL
jgi:hypothetical protein